MKLAVIKNPSPETLATCTEHDDKDQNLPKGAVWMTPSDFRSWKEDALKTWTPPPAPEEVEPVPESVTKRQLFLVLNAERGITRDDLADMIKQNPNEKERENGLIELQEASAYERNHPLVIQLASALSLTPEDVDHIYRAAAKL